MEDKRERGSKRQGGKYKIVKAETTRKVAEKEGDGGGKGSEREEAS